MPDNEYLPKDGGGRTMQLTPSRTALARTVDTTISTSTQVDFNSATTFIRVYAIDKDVYLKWGTTAVTSGNFDEVIPANQIVDLVLPFSSAGVRYPSVNLIERASTGGFILIEK